MAPLIYWQGTCKTCCLRKICADRTFGRTNNALNFENTRNISLALRAVPRRSRSREMIWFSTRDTRSLYAFSAATQISVPSIRRHELHTLRDERWDSPVDTSKTSIRFMTSYASFTSSSMSIPPTSIPTPPNPFVGPVITASC